MSALSDFIRGGGYWFLDHSPWHGLTVADLVMIIGFDMNYVLNDFRTFLKEACRTHFLAMVHVYDGRQ